MTMIHHGRIRVEEFVTCHDPCLTPLICAPWPQIDEYKALLPVTQVMILLRFCASPEYQIRMVDLAFCAC